MNPKTAEEIGKLIPCRRCGQSKPLSDYYVPPLNLGTCKLCKIKLNAEYLKTEQGHRKTLLAIRKRRDANPEKHRAAIARHLKKNPNKWIRDVQLRDPKKVKARLMVRWAIEGGRMKRPANCDDCGKMCKPHGHHEDYNKPLEVNWLCVKCHGLRHRIQLKVGAL